MNYQIIITIASDNVSVDVTVPDKDSPKPSFNELIGCLEMVKATTFMKEVINVSIAPNSPPPPVPPSKDNTDTKTHNV